MLPLRALIFDVDGTLAETEDLHRDAFNDAFRAAGLDWHWDQSLYAALLAVTGGKERMRHYQQRLGTSQRLSNAQVAALHEDKTARYTARLGGAGLPLRPGIRRLLIEASESGCRLAIATTTSRANVTALLAAAGTLPPFEVIAAGDDVPAKKPAPDVYRLALQNLGLPASECLAIEDTQNGVASAVGAGLPCVVTTSAYGGAGPFPGAACVLTALGDPGAPGRVLQGPPLQTGIVDLAWLGGLYRGGCSA